MACICDKPLLLPVAFCHRPHHDTGENNHQKKYQRQPQKTDAYTCGQKGVKGLQFSFTVDKDVHGFSFGCLLGTISIAVDKTGPPALFV